MHAVTTQWSGSSSIKGSSEPLRMALLTFSLIGLQFCWGLESTYCTPYLLSLGLSKSKTSLVWIAGPLSGLLMQPLVGAIADRSTSRFGRRRPFMIGGAIVVSICLLLLGWTRQVVSIFVSHEEKQQNATIVVAVLAIYAVDFAINAVQACCRSLIVDSLSVSQQQTGSAWAARMAGAGHLAGFLIGTVDLVGILPNWLGGSTQFKKMTVISASSLCITTGITSWAVSERVLVSSPEHDTPVWAIIPDLFRKTLYLPSRIQAICWCQFWAWIGWFPFLFYSSTWVGETYYRYEHKIQPGEDRHDTLGTIGRLGSLALVLFSAITLTSSIILPHLIYAPDHDGIPPEKRNTQSSSLPIWKSAIAKVSWISKPDLVSVWLCANLSFALIMFWAPFVRSVHFATVLVALSGVPWAIGSWAPFAEMGVEINKMASGGTENSAGSGEGAMIAAGGYQAVRPSMDEDDVELEMTESQGRVVADGVPAPDAGPEETQSSSGELSGIYLGVLNVYTTLPQFVATFISWIVFSILEPRRAKADADETDPREWLDTEGINAISVCLFVGALCAVVAAEATRRLKKLQ